mmetsp:Transcript_61087/g.172199  ORF Transcript_61087/g.172199 Transcript_61087/m.172199 type:complete len:392 (+) Transcript_61087:69-1244(+)
MPNPGAMTSLQAFNRENINTVIHIPDYKLRLHLALQQHDALVVEAFVAFEEMFYLHFKWTERCNYPEIQLSSVGARYHKLVMDLNIQSPHFNYSAGEGSYGVAAPQWVPCMWSTPKTPIEVQRPNSSVKLVVDRPPTYHNDLNISLEQTVTFTLIATMWELDDSPINSLQCKSFRARALLDAGEKLDTSTRMIDNVASTRDAEDVEKDIVFELDDGAGTRVHSAHSFVLQSQSPVFRRMLAGPMTEATERTIKMSGVTHTELEDFLAALYGFAVPAVVAEDEERLVNLLALSDRYEVLPLRDECAKILEPRMSEANMAALLGVADRHQAMGLRSAALAFINERIERIAAVMDTDDPSLRRSIRDHLAAAEASYRAHTDAADLKPIEITLTV